MIMQRIEQYSSREIRFNLMGVIADRRLALQEQQASIEKERNMTVGKVQARSGRIPTAAELDARASSTPPPPPVGEAAAVDDRSVDELLVALAHLNKRSQMLAADMQMEQQKSEQWKIENRRRKHNYVPFLVQFLKLLAERGELMPLVDAAKSRKRPQGR